MPRSRRPGHRRTVKKNPSYYLLPLGISITIVILVTVVFNVMMHMSRLSEQALRSEPIAKVSVETDNVAVIFNGERTRVYKGYTVDWNNDEGFETGEGARLQLPLATGDHMRLDAMSTAFGKRDEGRSIVIGFQKGRAWLRSEKNKPERESTLLRMNHARFVTSTPVTVAMTDTETEETIAVLAGSLPVMVTDSQGKVLRNVVVGVGQQITLTEATATALETDAPLQAIPAESMMDPWFTWNLSEDTALASYEGTPPSQEETNPQVPAGALTFANLSAGGTFPSKTIELEGAYMPEVVASLTINGTSALLDEEKGTWKIPRLTFAEAGKQLLTISYTTPEGQEVAFGTREITIDESAPQKPTLTSPTSTELRSDHVELVGTAPEGTARIVINNYELKKFKEGNATWVYYLNAGDNMVPGPNTYSVVAIDKVGNKSEPLLLELTYTPGATPPKNANTNTATATPAATTSPKNTTTAPSSTVTPVPRSTPPSATLTPVDASSSASSTLTPTPVRTGTGAGL